MFWELTGALGLFGGLAMPDLRAGPNLLRNVARRGNLIEISRSGSSEQHAARELVSNPTSLWGERLLEGYIYHPNQQQHPYCGNHEREHDLAS
jgi:hypothetical protein